MIVPRLVCSVAVSVVVMAGILARPGVGRRGDPFPGPGVITAILPRHGQGGEVAIKG
jgi:hypothetical protein